MKHRRHRDRRSHREKVRDEKRLSLAATVGLIAFGGLFVGALYLGFRGDPISPAQLDGTPAQQSLIEGVQSLPVKFVMAESTTATSITRQFSICKTGGGVNCVVDGDTIWLDGVKIRVADIDAPETHPPRCQLEADLGNKATIRLQALLNAGPFEARSIGSRDVDKYGRKLRVLMRESQSLGETLVQEGLARKWDGSRHPWC